MRVIHVVKPRTMYRYHPKKLRREEARESETFNDRFQCTSHSTEIDFDEAAITRFGDAHFLIRAVAFR